jgi:hypothetical protein
MNSSGLLKPTYLSIGPGLNLSGQATYLSPGARARNVPSLMAWQLASESAMEGMATMLSVVDDVLEVITIMIILSILMGVVIG